MFYFINSRLIEIQPDPWRKFPPPSLLRPVRVCLQKLNHIFLLVKSDPSAYQRSVATVVNGRGGACGYYRVNTTFAAYVYIIRSPCNHPEIQKRLRANVCGLSGMGPKMFLCNVTIHYRTHTLIACAIVHGHTMRRGRPGAMTLITIVKKTGKITIIL